MINFWIVLCLFLVVVDDDADESMIQDYENEQVMMMMYRGTYIVYNMNLTTTSTGVRGYDAIQDEMNSTT